MTRITTTISVIIVVTAVFLAGPGEFIVDLAKPSDHVTCNDYSYAFGNASWEGNTCQVFSSTYIVARQRFRDACPTKSIALPVTVGVAKDKPRTNTPVEDGTTESAAYTMDVCVLPGKAPGLVVHMSGTHGIEGYAGSAIQIAYMTTMTTSDSSTDDPTVVFLHAFNPYGMAHHRRTNENNVDLNRNGLSDDEWLSYAVFPHHWNYNNFETMRPFFAPTLVGTYWWPSVVKVAVLAVISLTRYGISTLKEAMVGGQYHDPTAIFYGGSQCEASYNVLDQWLDSFLPAHTTPNDVLTWIDVHTGLGKSGEDTLLTRADVGNRQEICPWFVGTHCSVADAASVSQGYDKVRGGAIDYIQRKHFAATKQPLLFAQEFGTISLTMVGMALILENAAHQKGLDWALQTTRHAFYPQSPAWRMKIIRHGLRVIQQAKDRSRQLSLETVRSR